MADLLEGLTISRGYKYDQDIMMAELEMDTMVEDMMLDVVEEDQEHETMDLDICQEGHTMDLMWINLSSYRTTNTEEVVTSTKDNLEEDSQDEDKKVGGQRITMTVSDMGQSSKSHRQTLILGTDYSGTGNKGIQPILKVVPTATVPPEYLVDSDYLKLPSINGSVGGKGTLIRGKRTTI
jgi:hypothetical protein